MRERSLGRSGYTVSEIGFGAWAIGGKGYGPVAEADAKAALGAYLDAGGNFIDTARGYGESERIIGEVLADRADAARVVLATKTPKHEPADIRADVETSRRLLGRDRLDVLFLHAPPEDTERMRRAHEAMEQLKAEGRIGAIGASIKGPNVTEATTRLCRQYIASGSCEVIQLIYSIYRQRNAEVFAEAKAAGVGLVGRTALESGFLTGKYAPGDRFGDHRRRWDGERLDIILRETEQLGERYTDPPFDTPARLAIGFALASDAVSTVILGMKDRAQAERNLGAGERPPLPESIRSDLRQRYAGFNDQCNTQ